MTVREDLDAAMQAFADADMTVTVNVDGVTALALHDMPDVDQFEHSRATAFELEIPAHSIPGIARGKTATVDGESFRITDVRRLTDGRMLRVQLAK